MPRKAGNLTATSGEPSAEPRRSSRIKVQTAPNPPKKHRQKTDTERADKEDKVSRGKKRKADEEANGAEDGAGAPIGKKAKPASKVKAPTSKPASEAAKPVSGASAKPASKTAAKPASKVSKPASRAASTKPTSRAGSKKPTSKADGQPAASASVQVDDPIAEEPEAEAAAVADAEAA